MKTDVIAPDDLAARAADAVKRPDGTVDPTDHLTAIDAAALHAIDLRFDLELTPEEVAGIAEAALAEYALRLAEREVEPHVVHQSKPYEAVDDETVASDADETDPRPKGSRVRGSRYIGLEDCPDCTRGLVSRGDNLVCVQVPRRTDIKGTKPGDIIACGRPR